MEEEEGWDHSGVRRASTTIIKSARARARLMISGASARVCAGIPRDENRKGSPRTPSYQSLLSPRHPQNPCSRGRSIRKRISFLVAEIARCLRSSVCESTREYAGNRRRDASSSRTRFGTSRRGEAGGQERTPTMRLEIAWIPRSASSCSPLREFSG